MKWTNGRARESAIIYAEALLEACFIAKVSDPCRALTDADEFPKLKKISEVEYAIGWLNGCAESHGVIVEVLWKQIQQDIADRTSSAIAGARAARRSTKPAEKKVLVERNRARRVVIKRAGGYDPKLGPKHPDNQDPTLEPKP